MYEDRKGYYCQRDELDYYGYVVEDLLSIVNLYQVLQGENIPDKLIGYQIYECYECADFEESVSL